MEKIVVVETRRFTRRNRQTGEIGVVTVSNRNNLSVEKQIELLNLNDTEFEYISCEK